VTSVFQIVDDDLATVLFDLNDATGANNAALGGSLRTYFGLGGGIDLGVPDFQAVRFEPSAGNGGLTLTTRDGFAVTSFRMRVAATSYDKMRLGIGYLSTLMRRGGHVKFVPEGSANTLYFDYEPNAAPALLDGRDLGLFECLRLFDSPRGVLIVLVRQPYLYGDLIDSDANKLTNSTLLADVQLNGRPLQWAWDSTTNITAESIHVAQEAYTFAIATSSQRNLQQTTPAATCAPSDIWTFSFYAKIAATDANAKARAVVRFKDSGGTNLGSEQAGTLTVLTTSWQRLTVTTSGAPASTDKAQVSLRMENADAASKTVFLRDAQMEEASGASAFRVGTEKVYVTPKGAHPAPPACTGTYNIIGGNVNLGLHSYKITYVISGVETEGGPTSNVVNVIDAGGRRVDLTGISRGPTGTTDRKVYRTVAGDTGNHLLAVTIANNSATTVQDNVADASLGAACPTNLAVLGLGRVIPVKVASEVQTPLQLDFTAESGGNVQQILVAGYGNSNVTGDRSVVDYLNNRKWFTLSQQTLTNDTSIAIPVGLDTAQLAVNKSVARVSGAGANPTAMAKRVRLTTSTLVECLLGTWDVYLRIGPYPGTTNDEYRVQVRWGPSTVDPSPFAMPEVIVNDLAHTTGAQMSEFYMGRLTIPAGVALSGVSFEVWTRRLDSASGASLDLDTLMLIPVDSVSYLGAIIPGRGSSWTGPELVTPTSQPSGKTAGRVLSERMTLNDDGDAAGTPPNTGMTLSAGRHVFFFTFSWSKAPSTTVPGGETGSIQVRVRNITDNNNAAVETATLPAAVARATQSGTYRMEFDAVAGKSYQLQFEMISSTAAGSTFSISRVVEAFVPVNTGAQVLHTDPERETVDQLTTTGTFLQPYANSGPVPIRCNPGLNLLHIAPLDTAQVGAPSGQSIYSRYVSFRHRYRPRSYG
jgi:hypothetical protein